jgi:hypothetical protein
MVSNVIFAGIIGGAIKGIFFAGVFAALLVVGLVYILFRKKG